MARIPFPSSVTPYDTTSDRTEIDWLIRDHIARMGPPMFAEIVAFRAGEDGAPDLVDVHPMVHQQDAAGRPYPHGTIYGIPFMRIQSGSSAILMDPQPGDIGFLLVSGRDHSGVVASQQSAPPGSFRQYDLSDTVFVGAFLHKAPTQYLQFTENGIKIVSRGPIEIVADNVQISGHLKVSGDVSAGNISLQSHVHGGVQAGGATTSKPE